MTNTTAPIKAPARRRVGIIAAVLLCVGMIGGLAWWYGPGNAPSRYRRMSLLELNQTLNRNPKDALAARTLALRLAGEGDAGMGEPALRTALALNPNDPEVATGLGELLMSKGRYAEAFQALKSVAARFPHYEPGRSALGRLYMKKGSYLHASTEYEAVVAQDKSADDAWYQLAVCYLQMQQSAKAQNAIDAALRLQPEEPHYLALKGSVDVAVGNVGAGIDETRRAAQLAPRNIRIIATLTNLLLAQHRSEADLDMAEQTIGRLEQLNPDYPLLPFQRGELERLRQHWPAAAHYLERALATTPNQDEVYFSLSQVYRRLNRMPEADRMIGIFRHRQQLSQQMDAVRIALGSSPDDPNLYVQLADLQMQLGDKDGAIGSVKAGLALDPKSVPLLRRLQAFSGPPPSGSAPRQ
ncbi:MAG: Tetratricopeptide repeat [Chthonomonadaceae bacterium]|nr:Tetratricopeptide repeat [Chthonomonadaceae bacterium]